MGLTFNRIVGGPNYPAAEFRQKDCGGVVRLDENSLHVRIANMERDGRDVSEEQRALRALTQ